MTGPALAQSTLEVIFIGEPQSLNPMLSTQDVVSIVTRHFVEALYTFYSGWNSAPLLGTELPAISEDGRSYTITLRDSITFHDGSTMDRTEVTASL